MKSIAVSCALFAAVAVAQTTLYIPGFDPQAITADVEGVDASGRTTWRIGPGVSSGTFDGEAGIAASATLVEGPSDAHLVYNDPNAGIFLSEDCAIANGLAACTAVASVAGILSTAIDTETAAGFVVQAGAATGVPTASGSDASTSTPTAGSAAASGPSATTTAGATNGAARMSGSVGSVLFAGLMSALFL